MNDICLVVQGRTDKNFVNAIKEKFKIPIIFSTWSDADKTAYDDSDIVLYNQYPSHSGPQNFQLQRVSSLNGFYKAKELGYSRVIKWRCDLEPNNSEELIKLFDRNCINFYAYVEHMDGYLTDYFIEGDVDDMIQLFDIDANPPYPEYAFTKRLYELRFDKKINFLLNKLTEDNDILFKHSSNTFWMTNNKSLAQFKDTIPK